MSAFLVAFSQMWRLGGWLAYLFQNDSSLPCHLWSFLAILFLQSSMCPESPIFKKKLQELRIIWHYSVQNLGCQWPYFFTILKTPMTEYLNILPFNISAGAYTIGKNRLRIRSEAWFLRTDEKGEQYGTCTGQWTGFRLFIRVKCKF